MKKIVFTFILTFLFVFCTAPPPNKQIKESKSLMLWQQYQRQEYQKEFNRFIEHLGLKESGNNWEIINQINCIGKWQFSPGTLRHLGYGHITSKKFRQNPNIFPEELQRQVLMALIKSNEIALKNCMQYVGQTVKGVYITKSGLLAASHLAGAKGVKLFLTTKRDPADCNGTSVSNYLTEFAGYEI